MKGRFQFGRLALAAVLAAGAAVTCSAQRPSQNDRPARQEHQQERRQERPQARQERRQEERRADRQNTNRPPERLQENNRANRPPDRMQETPRQSGQAQQFDNRVQNPNRPRFVSPEEQRRLRENNQKLRNLPPAERQELDRRARVWQKMTPEQRQYIRNEVAPKWREMPPERRQTIRRKLQTLQNMPEEARNRRLNDPEFTRGMSEDDKETLRKLSHLHVGEPPDEQP